MFRGRLFCLALTAAAGLAGAAWAFDQEAGVPLSPAEAAGGWTLSSNGQAVCAIHLSARHGVRADAACSGLLSGEPTGWAPTHEGMRLIDQGGRTVASFDRWSNSLFVTVVGSPVDIQMRRGD